MAAKRAYRAALADLKRAGLESKTLFVMTGAVRPLEPGEWFISGALPCAYFAPHGTSAPMAVAVPLASELGDVPVKVSPDWAALAAMVKAEGAKLLKPMEANIAEAGRVSLHRLGVSLRPVRDTSGALIHYVAEVKV